MDPADALLRTAIFRDLGRRDVDDLLPCLRQRAFARGESLWAEGDPAAALYIVVEGQLKSYRVSRDGVDLILGIVPSGHITGEVGLFHPSGVRQVCVTAMEREVSQRGGFFFVHDHVALEKEIAREP